MSLHWVRSQKINEIHSLNYLEESIRHEEDSSQASSPHQNPFCVLLVVDPITLIDDLGSGNLKLKEGTVSSLELLGKLVDAGELPTVLGTADHQLSLVVMMVGSIDDFLSGDSLLDLECDWP